MRFAPYRIPEPRPEPPPDPFLAAWADLRRRRWLAALTLVVAAVAVYAALPELRLGWVGAVVATGALYLVAYTRAVDFPCPYCGNYFAPVTMPLQRRCQRCGIAVGTLGRG